MHCAIPDTSLCTYRFSNTVQIVFHDHNIMLKKSRVELFKHIKLNANRPVAFFPVLYRVQILLSFFYNYS